ncbi:MAG: SH3 domain-containing protein [bacterium]
MHRRVHWLVSGGLLALALLCSREARAERVEINATSLTVRAGPGKKHKRIGSVPKGSVFDVLKRKGPWVAIQHGSRKGWVFGRFVRVVTGRKPAANNSPTPVSGTHTVTATRLNVRGTASVKGKLRFSLLRGDRVTVKETKGRWQRIVHRGKSGWVMGRFLTTGALPPPRRRAQKRRPITRRKPRKVTR